MLIINTITSIIFLIDIMINFRISFVDKITGEEI